MLIQRWSLRDYTSCLLLGPDTERRNNLLEKLVMTNDTLVISYQRANYLRGNFKHYRDCKELEQIFNEFIVNRNTQDHLTCVLDLCLSAPTSLNNFIRAKREHNTTLIVASPELGLFTGNPMFDLVFHLFPTVPSAPDTRHYQDLITTANELGGILVTDSTGWLKACDPNQIMDHNILGAYSL